MSLWFLGILFLSMNGYFDVKISGKKRQGRSASACGLLQIQRSHGIGERIGVCKQGLDINANAEISGFKPLKFMIMEVFSNSANHILL